VLTGIATVEVSDGTLTARGDGPNGTEVFTLPLPAVVAIQEGGIAPRYPSIPGRMKAKRTVVETTSASFEPVGSGRVRLKLPPAQPNEVTILGTGADAAPALVDLLVSIGVVSA
jgi:electron transfer flavoprotein beta subunit